jgi:hypothetical protein
MRLLANMMIFAVAPLVVIFYLPFYRRLNVSTAYEYLERRFHLSIRLLCSLMFILFQFGRIGIVLFLPSIALAAVTGMDVYLCIAVMGILATIYTALGGIEAVIWTDVIQVVVLVGGALLCVAIILVDVGGFGPVDFREAEIGNRSKGESGRAGWWRAVRTRPRGSGVGLVLYTGFRIWRLIRIRGPSDWVAVQLADILGRGRARGLIPAVSSAIMLPWSSHGSHSGPVFQHRVRFSDRFGNRGASVTHYSRRLH